MADAVITAPLKSVEPQQVTIAASSSASAGAGVIKIVLPNGTTNDDLRRALAIAERAVRRDPNVFTGV